MFVPYVPCVGRNWFKSEKLIQIRKKNIYQIPSKISKLTFNRTRIELQLWWWPTIWPDFTRLYHGEQCLDDGNGNQNGKMVMMMMTHMLVPCVGNVGQVESTYCHLGWMASWMVLVARIRFSWLYQRYWTVWMIFSGTGEAPCKQDTKQPSHSLGISDNSDNSTYLVKPGVLDCPPYLWTTVDGTALGSVWKRVNHKMGRLLVREIEQLSTCYLGVFEQEWLWLWPPQLHHPAETMLSVQERSTSDLVGPFQH